VLTYYIPKGGVTKKAVYHKQDLHKCYMRCFRLRKTLLNLDFDGFLTDLEISFGVRLAIFPNQLSPQDTKAL